MVHYGNDGAKTYLLLTNQGDVYGGWNTLDRLLLITQPANWLLEPTVRKSDGNALTATSCKRQDGFLVLSLMVPKILL